MSKKKMEPEVRFEGFESKWKIKLLSEFLTFSNGINAPKESYGKGRKMISVMDILDDVLLRYEGIRNSVSVKEEIENNSRVDKGDLVFVRSSEVVNEVGWAKAYLDEKYALYSGFSIRGKRINKYYALFLELTINEKARKQIESRSGGSTRFNVSQSILNELKVIMPDLDEQKEIGRLFKTLNTNINSHQHKLTKLNSIKQAMLQKMFPKEGEKEPEVRFEGFSGEWNQLKIEDLITKGGSGGTPTSTNPAFYGGDIPFLSISDISKSNGIVTQTEKTITKKGLESSSAYLIPKGSVSLAMYASVGKVAILGIDTTTSQAFYNMEFDSKELAEYVFAYLTKVELENGWKKMISTGTQANLNANKVKNFELFVPNRKELIKISEYFVALNKLITSKQSELEKLKQFKRAMLQRIFA